MQENDEGRVQSATTAQLPGAIDTMYADANFNGLLYFVSVARVARMLTLADDKGKA